MKTFLLICLIVLALSERSPYEKFTCMTQSKGIYDEIKKAVTQNDISDAINSV